MRGMVRRAKGMDCPERVVPFLRVNMARKTSMRSTQACSTKVEPEEAFALIGVFFYVLKFLVNGSACILV
jgi:hypothetical protein